MIPERITSALRVFQSRFDDGKTQWALAGSVAMALHGLPVNPKEIEVVTDKLNLDYIDRVLEKDRVFAPGLHLDERLVRLTMGQYSLPPVGTPLRLLCGLEYRQESGQWIKAANFQEGRHFGELGLPLVSLEWLLDYYTYLERPARVNVILSKLAQ